LSGAALDETAARQGLVYTCDFRDKQARHDRLQRKQTGITRTLLQVLPQAYDVAEEMGKKLGRGAVLL